MAKVGRKSIYDTVIEPHLEDIKKAVQSGATITEIAEALGIAESTLYKYKAEKTELADAFARGRKQIVIDIKAALLKKAMGFEYKEEKKVSKRDKLTGEVILMIEEYKRYQPPSETAAGMLLRNYDDEWLDKDNATTQLKQQEFELRKAIADSNNFDLD